jgi:Mitochondrial branched-chain alpha-ketoacid dehydrogenase kinase
MFCLLLAVFRWPRNSPTATSQEQINGRRITFSPSPTPANTVYFHRASACFLANSNMLKATTSAANKTMRRCLARGLKQERGMASKRTANLQAPSTMMARVSEIDFRPNGSSRRSPSGWNKTIVSLVSSMPIEYEAYLHQGTSPQSINEGSMATMSRPASSDLTLKVDMEELKNLARMRCTPLSLKDMYKYAVDFSNSEQRLRNAQFLHRELPVRISQRAVDLLTLPHGLSEALPIRQIAHMYLLYLEKFQECAVPTTPDEEADFTEMLNSLVLDRSSIPNAIAKGVDEWLRMHPESTGDVLDGDSRIQQMEDALYRFFTARIGLRFLTEHHILSNPSRRERCASIRRSQSSFLDEEDVDNDFLGCIHIDCNPSKEVRKVALKIKRQTEDYYGLCPDIQIIDSTRKSDTKFTYVPHHLHYMVGELIKNSCRATVRR